MGVVLGVLVAIFGLFGAFMLGALAILLWKNENLRKDAKKDVDAIASMANDMQNLLETMKKKAQLQEKYQVESLERMQKEIRQMRKIKKVSVSEMESEYKKRLNKLDDNINQSLNSLASMSTSLPSSPSASYRGGASLGSQPLGTSILGGASVSPSEGAGVPVYWNSEEQAWQMTLPPNPATSTETLSTKLRSR